MDKILEINLNKLLDQKDLLDYRDKISKLNGSELFLLDLGLRSIFSKEDFSFDLGPSSRSDLDYLYSMEKDSKKVFFLKYPIIYKKEKLGYIVTKPSSRDNFNYESFYTGVELLDQYLIKLIDRELTKNNLSLKNNQLRLANLRTLESQMSPHFIFNSLNSITRMAFFENAKKTEEMTYNLSDLLRYNLRDFEEFPSLRKEIDNIEKYFFMQKIRFGDRLEYNISIDSRLLDYRVPNMIIQPLVENAIIHGIQPKSQGGSVLVSAEKDRKNIIVKIIDTGLGIDEAIISKLLNNQSHGLGVSNSNKRLISYFGSDYGLKIYSDLSNRTVVEVRFPAFKNIFPKNPA